MEFLLLAIVLIWIAGGVLSLISSLLVGAQGKEADFAQTKAQKIEEACREAAIEDGCRIRAEFIAMSDDGRQAWGSKESLFEDFRYDDPTFINLPDEDSTLGVCVPGNHPEASYMDVDVRRTDGSVATKTVSVMWQVGHEDKWVSICMIIE